ncbi:MAG: hypothetical protein ACXW13_07800 [Burkholderiaceae bacterium]
MGRIKRQLAAEAAAEGGRSISYEKGCGVASDEGVLEAIRAHQATTPPTSRSMRQVIVAFACAGLAGFATAEVMEVKLAPGSVLKRQLAVPPAKFSELCATLRRGRVVEWQFRADAPSDFNIHYHVDKRVEYPERLTQAKDAGGRLLVEVDQAYCWMWTNRSAMPIAIEVTLKEASR